MSVGSSSIVRMFDSSVVSAEPDAVQLAAAITDNQAVLRQAECRVLELACAWADAHSREPGTYLYRTPTGQIYLVTNQGTLCLGTSPFAQATWHSANYIDTDEEAS